VMCAEQSACVRRRSWAGYTINMFEFEFPTGTPNHAAAAIMPEKVSFPSTDGDLKGGTPFVRSVLPLATRAVTEAR
jgi:hypothetical protein